jgi:glycosyltransferase involved in cell wall biosynthesis
MKEVINKAGIERAKKFTWNATATQLIEIINEIEKENA